MIGATVSRGFACGGGHLDSVLALEIATEQPIADLKHQAKKKDSRNTAQENERCEIAKRYSFNGATVLHPGAGKHFFNNLHDPTKRNNQQDEPDQQEALTWGAFWLWCSRVRMAHGAQRLSSGALRSFIAQRPLERWVGPLFTLPKLLSDDIGLRHENDDLLLNPQQLLVLGKMLWQYVRN